MYDLKNARMFFYNDNHSPRVSAVAQIKQRDHQKMVFTLE